MASLESVRSFARAFNKEQRRLDVLICNAGIMAPPERQQTSDGLEMQFQVRKTNVKLQQSSLYTLQIATLHRWLKS